MCEGTEACVSERLCVREARALGFDDEARVTADALRQFVMRKTGQALAWAALAWALAWVRGAQPAASSCRRVRSTTSLSGVCSLYATCAG